MGHVVRPRVECQLVKFLYVEAAGYAKEPPNLVNHPLKESCVSARPKLMSSISLTASLCVAMTNRLLADWSQNLGFHYFLPAA